MEYKFTKGVPFKLLMNKLQTSWPVCKIGFDKNIADIETDGIEKTLTITNFDATEEQVTQIIDNMIVQKFQTKVCARCVTNAIVADYPNARMQFDCTPQDVDQNKNKRIIIDDCNISHDALTKKIDTDYSDCNCEEKMKWPEVCLPKEMQKVVKTILPYVGKTWDEFIADYKNQS